MEVEAAIYWRAARNLKALALLKSRTPALLARAGDAAADLEAVALHSEWPALREAAGRALAGGKRQRAAG